MRQDPHTLTERVASDDGARALTDLGPRRLLRDARPLAVLVPLIQDDLTQGRAAAEPAGLPYYRAAGEKIREAKSQLAHGEFQGWIKRHFKLTPQHARRYMQLAASEKEGAPSFSSLRDFLRHTREPVAAVSGINFETLNIRREELKRRDESELRRTLGLQLIDAGYKILAHKLHPDKGGSREAMARLNSVRAFYKRADVGGAR